MARRFPLVVITGLTTLAVVGLARPAAAADNMLRGPHPFLKQNEISAHMLLAAGGDDTPGGTKLAGDYGYKLQAPLWLNLQLNFQREACHSQSGGNTCAAASGSVYETLVGLKLKWPTAIPLVPFVKGAVGLAFAFPNGAANGWGIAARVGGGANYFIFDWLGVGGEIGYSIGHLSTTKPGYSVLDFGGGLEFQF